MVYRALLLVAFAIIGCVSAPVYQELKDGVGYKVSSAGAKDRLYVDVKLPQGTPENFEVQYALRAIGEECAKRGYAYFHQAYLPNAKYIGFCETSADRQALGVNLRDVNSTVVIEDLNGKKGTTLQQGDRITKINGVKSDSVADVKVQVANARAQKYIDMIVQRSGREVTVREPVAILELGNLGEKDLEEIRRRVK